MYMHVRLTTWSDSLALHDVARVGAPSDAVRPHTGPLLLFAPPYCFPDSLPVFLIEEALKEVKVAVILAMAVI